MGSSLKAFLELRLPFFKPFTKIHKSVAFANVSALTDNLRLRPGVCVIALHQNRVVLGEGECR